MDEKLISPDHDPRPNVIEGADAAALGTAPPPASAPPGASVDPTDRLADLPPVDEVTPATAERPWSTTLAARGSDAGVMHDDDVRHAEDPAFDRGDRDGDGDRD